jgi:hypothetical protein
MKSEINNVKVAHDMLNILENVDLPNVRNRIYVPEWINIGISYPEYNVNVLLTDGKTIGFGYLTKDGKTKHWKSHQCLGWITHWMTLPELPQSYVLHGTTNLEETGS